MGCKFNFVNHNHFKTDKGLLAAAFFGGELGGATLRNTNSCVLGFCNILSQNETGPPHPTS